MTTKLTLNAMTRSKNEKRKEMPLGQIPGILYGRGIASVMLWFNRRAFNQIYDETGESAIFRVKTENGGERNVIIKEVQRDILNGKPIHVDFYQVRMDEKIEAAIELDFTGESPAVKELGGVLIKNMDEIPVKCLPADLPPRIVVDISKIKTFEDYIYIKDLHASEKVEVLIDSENVVAMVSPPRSEEELAELETEVKEDVSQVEGVEKEEKEEEVEEQKVEGEEKKDEKKPARSASRSVAGGEEKKK